MKFSIIKAAAAVTLFVPLLAAAAVPISLAIAEVSPTDSSATYNAD